MFKMKKNTTTKGLKHFNFVKVGCGQKFITVIILLHIAIGSTRGEGDEEGCHAP